MDPTTGHDVPGYEPFPPALAANIDRIATDLLAHRRPVPRRRGPAGYRPDLAALLERLEAQYVKHAE